MFRTFLVVATVAALCTAALPSQLNYEVGQLFEFQLHGSLDARGSEVDSQQRTNGSSSTMDAVLKAKCTEVHSDYYMFVMNMFGTVVNVGQGVGGGVTGEAQSVHSAGSNDPLGYDMYFQQMKTGEIPKVWYNTADSPYYVNVKLGAINAFQTHIIPSGQSKTVLEEDPVGSHYSVLKGSGDDSLVLVKTFSQNDFQSFPDKKLHKSNVAISATTSTTVHNTGYIMQSTVDQTVVMVNMAPQSQSKTEQERLRMVTGSDTALNVDLSSKGHLSIDLLQSFQTDEKPVFASTVQRDELEDNAQFTGNSMFEAASWLTEMAQLEVPDIDFSKSMDVILSNEIDHQTASVLLMKVSKYLTVPQQEDMDLLKLYASRLDTLQAAPRSRLLALLAELPAQELLITFGLRSPIKDVVIASAFATVNAREPSQQLLNTLEELAFEALDVDIRESALLSYGAVIGESKDVQVSRRLMEQMRDIENLSEDEAVTLIHAIGNAGPQVIPVALFPVSTLQSTSPFVRAAATHALRQYKEDPTVVSLLLKISKFDKAQVVRKAAWKIISELDHPFGDLSILEDSTDFPFNRSFDKNITLGGKSINAQFSALLFAGTNFDCKEDYFNYKAEAEGTVDVQLFGFSKQAFIAEAIYGRENGAIVGDKIYLKVWNKVLYDKKIPSLDCSEHTYPLASTTKGLDVSYTLWVSVIPVTFAAGGQLTLTLKWGWNICDSDLSAMVELIPAATFTVYGKAEINLLIIRAGLEISGAFNTQMPPQGYIHGSKCQLGLDLKRVSDPMTIDLTSYFQWKKCKFLIFDCHWGKHNQHTWFHWGMDPVNKVIYDKHWDIKA